nr:reverse transcriptase domain-containing protein [Tanacetum cinerariifolium]
MTELLRSPTKGYAEAIVVPPILTKQFELKHSLINMMTSDQFFGLEKDNPHDHIRWFNKITSTIKYKDVPNAAIKLMLFPFSLAGAARRWLEKEPPRSIQTWEDLVSKFINEFFAPSRTINLRNEIFIFQQRFDESFHEAWDRYKDLLHACPHYGFTKLHQLGTFYNALNPADQDSFNAAVGGNLLERRTQDVLTIIENKSKVCNSRNKSVVSQVKSCYANSSLEIAKLTHVVNQQTSAVTTAMMAILKQFQETPPPASVKAVEEIYVTCDAAVNYNQGNSIYHPPGSGSLPSNTVANLKGELKAITTRSGLVLDGPIVSTTPSFINPGEDERVEETLIDSDLSEYTIKVPPPPVQKYKPPSQIDYILHQRDPLYPNIPYPSRMLKQKQQEKDEYQKMLKALLSNKKKLQELIDTPLNENCSAKLGVPELISTRMTLELANRAICTPTGIARDVFVLVGKFTFLADFVIVDYKSDLRVPLILGRPFLWIAHALIDVHEVESDAENVYDDPFDSMGEKDKESKLLIDELDLHCDLPPSEYDSIISQDFSRVDSLSSTNNEDKVLNPGILIQEKLFEIITRVVQDKKLDTSNASLVLEDFDPPFYEPLFFKEVSRPKMLLLFSTKNEEKVFKPRIHTSEKVHSSLISEISHQGYKFFKINQIFKSLMKSFLFSCGKDTHILVVPCLHFYPIDQFKYGGIGSS